MVRDFCCFCPVTMVICRRGWLAQEEANRLSECMPEGMKPVVIFALANTAWRIGLRRAGIEDFRFHDLRHIWASWLIQSGVPLSALQEMGGWESIEMVQRYAHLAPNHLTKHARKIDSLLSDNDTNTT